MRLALPLAAIAAFGLAGCAADPAARGFESTNQPIVHRTDFVFDVRDGGGGLAPGEADRLGQWFGSLRLGYGDKVTVDDPGHARALRDDVASVTARYGLLLGDVPPVTQGQVAPGFVRIVVSRPTASVPNCPDFSRPSQPVFDGAMDSNYGCASNVNLAKMVANPDDLLEGQQSDSNRSTRAMVRALNAYQSLTPSGASGTVKAESAKGGN